MNNSSYHYIIIERIITIEEKNIRSEGLRNLKTEENCRKIRHLFPKMTPHFKGIIFKEFFSVKKNILTQDSPALSSENVLQK